jgi:4-amino-4-deoxy-L-arabinose transferase-like glycosyltransferase
MRRSAFVVLAVAALTFFAGLGRSAISDSDEAYYAEAAREMLESGDFLTPRYNYENRFQKPVFFYWCVAASYAIGGIGEATARAPAAVAGVGFALLAWFMGRRWFGENTGFLAGLIISTCLGCAAIARLSLPDLPLAFFITVSIVAGFVALLDDGLPRLGALVLAAAAAGLGFLTKGPIGVALPALVLLPVVLLERRWAIRPLQIALALAVFVAIALPWYAAMTIVHGTAYLHSFFVTDNLERFATSRFNYPRPVWFYLPIILGGLLPWSAFMPLWIPDAFRSVRDRTVAPRNTFRLLVWVVLPLTLFTISVGKQPRYILPILPPFAILLAASIQSRLDRQREPAARTSRLLQLCAVVAGIVVSTVGVVLFALPAESLGLDLEIIPVAAAAALAAGLAVMFTAFVRLSRVPLVATGGAVVLVLALQYGVLSSGGPETVEQVAAEIRRHSSPDVEWTTHDVFVRNLVFYVARRESGPFTDAGLIEFLQRDRPSLAVMSLPVYERLSPQVGAPLDELGRWRFLNTAGIRVGSLLEQNFERELRVVVLVSNRPKGRR